jgi:hypothetical protein
MNIVATFSIGQASIFFSLSWMVTIMLYPRCLLRVLMENGPELQIWPCRL